MSRKMKTVLISLLVVSALIAAFGAGCVITGSTTSGQEMEIDVVNQVWGLIFNEYVETGRLDPETLKDGAIQGLMDALDDPYSSYLNNETYELSMSHIEGKFEGIGAYVGVRDDKITIIAPITGSPAEEAGIQAGDVILEVEGQSTADMTLNEVVLRIRGPEGTDVTILVLHQGETEPVEYRITRAEIELSSAYLEMMDNIAYLRVNQFTERTNDELTPIVDEITDNGAAGIIVDLRSNPGGLLDSVVDVTSRFLDDGYVLHSEDNRGKRTSYPVVNSGKKMPDVPVVILTDNFTASASEVFSGALQDYDRAVVAGTVTYGKGSVNTLYTLKDGSGVYITTHRWLTPNERLIEGKGITPDFEILEGDLVEWAKAYLEEQQ